MELSFHRYEILNRTVRFYTKEKQAIGHANVLTRLHQAQHRPLKHTFGWLVANVTDRTKMTVYDIDGPLPQDVLVELYRQDNSWKDEA